MFFKQSKLRYTCDLARKGLKILLNEGYVSFWHKFMEFTKYTLHNHRGESGELNIKIKYMPKFSIIMPVWKPDLVWLDHAIKSVEEQVYENWELCIAYAGSENTLVRKAIRNYSINNNRIKSISLEENLGIAGNSNEALKLATGEFVAFLDQDDELSPTALLYVANSLNIDMFIDILYSDEDIIDANSCRLYPIFKPSWSLDTLRCYNYITHLLVIRKKVINQIGGFRCEFEGAQDYDLVLRAVEVSKKIKHIPEILYHWRAHNNSVASNPQSKRYAHEAGKKALFEHLKRLHQDATIEDGKADFRYHAKYKLAKNYFVSIVIPTKDKKDLLENCVNSILKKSLYKNIELIILDNNSTESITHDYLNDIEQRYNFIKVLSYVGEFNWSKINNFACRYAKGDALIFLNNDTEVLSSNWIESLLEHAQRSDIGAVGCLLLYPDKKVQHSGVVIGMNRWADHVCSGMSPSEIEKNHHADVIVNCVRNVSAVTGACLCIDKNKFYEVGGFNENFKIGGGDVEFCVRLLGRGYRNIYTPYSILTHYESVSRRGIKISQQDYEESYKVYDKYGFSDPYYSKNFDYSSKIPKIR